MERKVILEKKHLNKKILFIGTQFANIEKHIISQLEKRGYSVDYYDDRPSSNSLNKALLKVTKSFLKPITHRYFKKIIDNTRNNKYEKVFILNGKIFTEHMILTLKKTHNQSEFIFYTYDSLSLYPHVLETLDIYDRAYSFDSKDCTNDSRLCFLPLFYSDRISHLDKIESQTTYDLLSICTAHPNRYKKIKELFPKLQEKGIKIYSYLYLNPFQFIYNKVKIDTFKNASVKEFRFKLLDEKTTLNLLSQSKCIFDVEHSNQTGLTYRTIEAFGANTKLITTNTNIEMYNFYKKENILIYNENTNIDEMVDFISSPYLPIDNQIYNLYSIENWVDTILNIKKLSRYAYD